MKYVLTIVLIALLSSCGGNLKQFQQLENAAMSAADLPLYTGLMDIASSSSFKTLTAGTLVYLTNDTIDNNGVKYVKVVYGDSSAYTLAHRLMPKGSWAVVTAAEGANSVYVYSNTELETVRQAIDNDWALVVVGEQSGDAIPVMYSNEYGEPDEPLTGYMPSALVYNDEGSVAFYNKYREAQEMYQAGAYDEMKALSNSSEYSGLRIFAWRSPIFMDLLGGDDMDERGDAETGEDYDENPYAEGDAEYGDYYESPEYDKEMATETGWLADGKEINESESPGTVNKFFIFADGSEMDANGWAMDQGYPYNSGKTIEKEVKKVRFEMIPTVKTNIVFNATVYFSNQSEYNRTIDKVYDNAEPGKKYSITIDELEGAPTFTCATLRVLVTTSKVSRAVVMEGSCGD